uniref:BUD13 homolog n=1 Tax=Lutzomyia longipalpis TaxID=7200 RepID=A0A1B0GK13_LUTLO
MSAKIDQKEYLKKYLSNDVGKEKKKKKKKRPITGQSVTIIDDDVDVSKIQHLHDDELEVLNTGEDAPQVVGVIDERPPELRAQDFKNSSKWKLIADDNGFESSLTVQELDRKSGRIEKSSKGKREYRSRSKKDNSSPDLSPVRHRRKSGSQSPPRRRKSSDLSPKRKRSPDLSPRRKRSPDLSPRRRRRSSSTPHRRNSSDLSPERRKSRNSKRRKSSSSSTKSSSSSPRRRSQDLSPKRKMLAKTYRRRSSESPPRRKINSESPMRHRRSPDSPPRRKRSPVSPPRRKKSPYSRKKSPDFQPTRKRSPESPPRRRRSPDSPPRRAEIVQVLPLDDVEAQNTLLLTYLRNVTEEGMMRPTRETKVILFMRHTATGHHKNRLETEKDQIHRVGSKIEIEVSSIRQTGAGTHTAGEVVEAVEVEEEISSTDRISHRGGTSSGEIRHSIEEMSQEWEIEEIEMPRSGLHGNILRMQEFLLQKGDSVQKLHLGHHLKGIAIREDISKEREKDQKEQEKKAVYDRWGKGLKQVEDFQQKMDEEIHEMSKPVARYSDDKDLDNYLKQQEREGDPMLEYIRQKEREKQKDSKTATMPTYRGPYPDNRFNIRPGYRWDGVDRSNGYEKKWFDVQNKKKALQEEAYRYSTEDL